MVTTEIGIAIAGAAITLVAVALEFANCCVCRRVTVIDPELERKRPNPGEKSRPNSLKSRIVF